MEWKFERLPRRLGVGLRVEWFGHGRSFRYFSIQLGLFWVWDLTIWTKL